MSTYWVIEIPDDPSPGPVPSPWAGGNMTIDVAGTYAASISATVDVTSQVNLDSAASSYQSQLITAGYTTAVVTADYNGGSGRTITFTFSGTAPSGLTQDAEDYFIWDSEAQSQTMPPITGPFTTGGGGGENYFLMLGMI